MNLKLESRTAFVAGASSGLGYAAARALLREGCRVAICSRSEDRIHGARDRLRAETGVSDEQVLALVCDVTKEDEIVRSMAAVRQQLGGLNILVTNAGGPPSGAISDFTSEDFRRAIELNLMSAINLVSAARTMLEDAAARDNHARVIMITSLSAKQPLPSLVLSNTARAGVQGYAKSLAEELGPTGITVNTILPGYTETERLDELAEAIERRTGKTPADIRKDWAAQNVLNRLGSPEEFAAALTFLAGKTAGYITGVALPVDGGRSRHLL